MELPPSLANGDPARTGISVRPGAVTGGFFMRHALALILACTLLGAVFADAPAREARRTDYRILRNWTHDEFAAEDVEIPEYLVPQLFTSSTIDTYTIVYFDFEFRNWQGWTSIDQTAVPDTFWHVEDYAEPGLAGLPGPVEGTKSAWCGAPPGPFEYMCLWVAAPGYGNSWDQRLVTDPVYFNGFLRLSYHGRFDSEPGCDRTTVEYDVGGGNWVEFAEYDGLLDTVAVHDLHLSQYATKLRFHFTSDGAWSDQDGLWAGNGAAHIDSITIEDETGVLDYEDFESAADNAFRSGTWHADVQEGFGIYAKLRGGLEDEDPCNFNFTSQIVFYDQENWAGPEFGQPVTPFCKGAGGIEAPCQNEVVLSPPIDINRYSTNRDEYQDAAIPSGALPGLGGILLGFTLYSDLPYVNLVGYNWRVRTIKNGCPGSWGDRGYINMGSTHDYQFVANPIGDLVKGDTIQVGLMVVDMCDVWYQVYGNCAAHTSAPYFDNVYVKRYSQVGPQWSYRDLDLFQDNFPEQEFYLESWVRADAANDLRPNDDPVIDPGDSIVVDCDSPLGGGIDTTAAGRPQVFLHARCHYIGNPLNPKPDLFGASLEGTYGTYDSDDGSEWTVLQCDHARTGAGNIAPGRYMVDLNDSLFTRGYRIDYYFSAYDHAGHRSTLPRYAETKELFFEWTCLPTLASDVLYVDDFHGRGTMDGIAQHYWESAFGHCVPPGNRPDRYDVNQPSSGVSNGPGSRAKIYQMTLAYRTVIWDSGNLSECTISEGTTYSDKSNDAEMLIYWMEWAPHNCGLWVCGDDVATDLAGATSPGALELLSVYCGVSQVHDSYFEMTGGLSGGGGIVSPLVRACGQPYNPLWHGTWGDSLYAFGGCPVINDFDVLEKTGNGEYALRYPDYGGEPYYAGILVPDLVNDGGYSVRTMWFGFSLMYLRDVEPGSPIMRSHVFNDVFQWFWNALNVIIGEEEIPAANSLAQNYPNPFNPATTIHFGVREKGRVTLRVYDVAGRLVRTLVDEVRDAGAYREVWDGTNNRGSVVASGVYFYRISAKEFEQTRKMVLLR